MKYLAVAGLLVLGACAPSPSADTIRALSADSASNCFGGVGYGVGIFGARANDPTVSVEVGPTGCKVTHPTPTTNPVVVIPANGNTPAQIIK